MMKSSNPLGADNARPVILFDLSLPLEERQDKKQEFATFGDAANFLGVHRHKVWRGIGGRVTSLRDGKEYAIREPKTNK